MPRIPSPKDTGTARSWPSLDTGYTHPSSTRTGRFIPMAFQVTSPLNRRMALLPHSLVLHTNPTTFSENPTKKIERIQTRGGFVEQHWGDELTEISGDSSTGAFMNLYTGTSSVMRQRTIAWDRYRDLLDLYYNNGSVYDPFGNIVLQGNLMLMYDKGTYIGYFTNFSVEETGDSPFAFQLSWTFKVEETILKLPSWNGSGSMQNPRLRADQTPAPNLEGAADTTPDGWTAMAQDAYDAAKEYIATKAKDLRGALVADAPPKKVGAIPTRSPAPGGVPVQPTPSKAAAQAKHNKSDFEP